MNLLIIGGVEFHGKTDDEMWRNEIPPNSMEPKEVSPARNREVRQTPHRKPTTQIWQGNELLIAKAFCDKTFCRPFCSSVSILFLSLLSF